MLEAAFKTLLAKYTPDEKLTASLWFEIEENYSGKKRHYHNLQHLENLLHELSLIKEAIKNPDCILFSIFYHDIIYNVLKADNEERSAALAEKRMKQANVPPEKIKLCRQQILATKTHILSDDSDTNYFTDADLSVLGQPWEVYEAYAHAVRKEFSVYPDFIYKPGRRKVLERFLKKDPVFKTGYFYEKLEQRARENMLKELKKL